MSLEPKDLPPPEPNKPEFLRSINVGNLATLIVRIDEGSVELIRQIVREELDRKKKK